MLCAALPHAEREEYNRKFVVDLLIQGSQAGGAAAWEMRNSGLAPDGLFVVEATCLQPHSMFPGWRFEGKRPNVKDSLP